MRDEEFVEEVYTASYRRLVGQLYLVCGELATAEDIVSEAFVRAVAHAREGPGSGVSVRLLVRRRN